MSDELSKDEAISAVRLELAHTALCLADQYALELSEMLKAIDLARDEIKTLAKVMKASTARGEDAP